MLFFLHFQLRYICCLSNFLVVQCVPFDFFWAVNNCLAHWPFLKQASHILFAFSVASSFSALQVHSSIHLEKSSLATQAAIWLSLSFLLPITMEAAYSVLLSIRKQLLPVFNALDPPVTSISVTLPFCCGHTAPPKAFVLNCCRQEMKGRQAPCCFVFYFCLIDVLLATCNCWCALSGYHLRSPPLYEEKREVST